MSTTVSVLGMTQNLQLRFPIGLSTAQWTTYVNEAFRKINQSQKGGFIWQLKSTTIVLPAGGNVPVALPADFDPGKSAYLYGTATSPLLTMIPYKPVSEFTTEQHFQSTSQNMFSSWTFYPSFVLGAVTSYGWVMKLAPEAAFPTPGATFGFYYHAVNFPPLTAVGTAYFPTPDQFDSLIQDFAEAEARRQYSAAGWDKLAASATATMNELIADYRTDRYDLAGIMDVTMQAQEKAAERDR